MSALTNLTLKDCIQNCWECRNTCQETLFNYCLQEGGDHIKAEHLKLMTDCIQACQTAADFMVRNSDFHASTCEVCADICEACAQSCDQIEGDIMKRCADACRRCAKSCREMSKLRKVA